MKYLIVNGDDFGYSSGGDVGLDIVWHTGTDHQPGTYGAHLEVVTIDSTTASSAEQTFKLTTPAKPNN